MNKIIEQSVAYPQVVKVYAEKYIMALYSSGWYEKSKDKDKDIKEEDKTKTIQELDREKLEEKFSKQDKEKLN